MVIAIVWTALMGFQLLRSIRIDAYELSQGRIDLLGYWLAFLISLTLGLWLLERGRMMLVTLYLVMLLVTYITLVITLTAPSQPIVSFLISRYGVAMWFVLGVGFSAVIDIITMARQRRYFGHARNGIMVVLVLLGLQSLRVANEILADPVQTLSYQSVASSTTIFLLVMAGVIVALWGEKTPIPVSLAYIGIGTVLVAAVALTQSTLIVALWLGIFLVFFGQSFRTRRLLGKIALLTVLLLGVGYFMQTEAYEHFTTKTRFAIFFASSGQFTSWTSRISLLSTFSDQFAVSPIFGHFQAEIVAGVGEGYYVHSLPLAFLTHTGLIGTTLFFSAFFLLIRKRTIIQEGRDFSEIHMGRMMWIILGVGTISAFLSWPPIWFMLGALCKRSMRNN